MTKGSASNPAGDFYCGQRRRRRQRRQERLLRTESASAAAAGATSESSRNSLQGSPFADRCLSFMTAGAWSRPAGRSYGGLPAGTPAPRTAVPLLNSPELQLRFLCPDDVPEVKRLCREWFPIDYPDSWYSDITSDPRFYSVCCTYRPAGGIVGLIVAEIKDAHALPREDSEILHDQTGLLLPFSLSSTSSPHVAGTLVSVPGRNGGIDRSHQAVVYGVVGHGDGGSGNGGPASYPGRLLPRSKARIGYILSLGVVEEYRKNGVASFLLDNLCAHVRAEPDVKALYLHVLTSNLAAIAFYERKGFRPHLFLPHYYAIGDKRKDGFTYVLYLNGGHPPWDLADLMVNLCWMALATSLSLPFSVGNLVLRQVFRTGRRFPALVSKIRRLAQSATAVFS